MQINLAKRALARLLAALAAFFVVGGSAVAAPIAVTDVPFENGQGTLSGYFQTDSATDTVTSWSLATSTFNCSPCGLSTGFPGFTYNQNNSTAQLGFFLGMQSITFHLNDPNTPWQVSFVLDCGGNSADCIGDATDGSTVAISSAFEMNGIDFLPYRALDLASITVTDPPGVLTFNVVAQSNPVPEPGTLLLLVPAFAGVLLLTQKKGKPRRS